MHSRVVSKFAEYWPVYVGAHQDVRNRSLHFVGTGGAFVIGIYAIATRKWILLLAAPIWGYGCAWFGHFCFERNRPAAFGSPVRAFRGDIRMFVFMLIGRMNRELERVRASSQIDVQEAPQLGTGSNAVGRSPRDGTS